MNVVAVRRDRDRGSGSVLVVGLLAVSVVLGAVVGLMAGVQGARARAQTAADLGALAAAQRLVAGGLEVCARALETVERNGAVLTGCDQLGGAVVEVRVAARSPVGDALAQARAGPRPPRG